MVTNMSTVVVDPSLFTLPYDDHLCSALADLGCEVTLTGRMLRRGERFLPTGYVKQAHFYPLSERLRDSGLSGRLHSSLKGIEHLYGMLKFALRMEASSPSVIHFQWLPIPFFDKYFLRRLGRRFPLVLTVHDSNPYNGSPHAALQVSGTTQAMQQFDRLIVHTVSSRNRLVAQGIDAEQITVVPHGLLNVTTARRSELGSRSARSVNSAKTSVLLFGKIKPYKGYDTLLDALALMTPSEREALSVLIVGEPCMDMTPMLNKVQQLGLADHVEFRLGFFPAQEIPELFAGVDIFAFPYEDIDASGALFECLPYGKPIVASRVGIFGEMLENGKHGVLIEPRDSVRLSQALLSIKPGEASYAAMGAAVSLLSTKATDWREIGAMTVAVYEHAIEQWQQRAG
jgi:glycosyltransferase involved in cell wall biosynthesis